MLNAPTSRGQRLRATSVILGEQLGFGCRIMTLWGMGKVGKSMVGLFVIVDCTCASQFVI